MPRLKPAMTEFSTETAARARVLTWPEKTWVTPPREYWQTEVKMAGPARYQSFFDSAKNSLAKSPAPAIGAMSSDFAVKTTAGSGVWPRLASPPFSRVELSSCVSHWSSVAPLTVFAIQISERFNDAVFENRDLTLYYVILPPFCH